MSLSTSAMSKSYDLSNIDEFVAFDKDCCDAVCQCPQVHGTVAPISPGVEISIAESYYKWFMDGRLWGLGWSAYLSKRAAATFKRYAVCRDHRVVDIETQHIFDPHNKIKVYGRSS